MMLADLNSIKQHFRPSEWSMKKWAVSFVASFFLIAVLLPSYWIAIMDSISLRKILPLPDRGNVDKVPLNCSSKMSVTCPGNYTPKVKASNLNHTPSCPDYFRWIYEDLKPWKMSGITRNMLERAKNISHFRLIIVNGKAYVEKYKQPYQTRDVFTLWGILQLMKLYPGKLPDLDLMFQCGDITMIEKKDYQIMEGSRTTNATLLHPPPVFHYCGDDSSFDIVFPDWSYWGWIETYIRPWGSLVEDLIAANNKIKWGDREPYAFWKGNIYNGRREELAKCNSTKDWNAKVYNMDWDVEAKQGFKDSQMASQCMHKYKIYMDGNAWSVSKKYIMACNSMTLVVNPRYYDFFSRSLIPLKHYWPIDIDQVCKSTKFAVDWGNKHPKEAEEIGRAGSKFIEEELKMKHVYEYMYHLFHEYAKLLRYKPSIPPGAVELCSEALACASNGTMEEEYKVETLVDAATLDAPCSMPPTYGPWQVQALNNRNINITKQVLLWESKGSK